MDIFMWFQIASAAFAGCLGAGSFGYAIWYAARIERDGGDSWKLPLHVALAGLIPLVIVGLSLMSVPV